jgi:hypothetical protein
MNTSSTLRNAAVAVSLLVAASAASATAINASPFNLTNTTSVGFGQQMVEPGAGFAFEYIFNVPTPIGGMYSNINWSPASTMATATFFQSDAAGNQGANPTLGTFIATTGTNLFLSYTGIMSGYYTVALKGTAGPGTTTLISGQASAIPAPAVLGLVGIGLLALGLGRKAVKANA